MWKTIGSWIGSIIFLYGIYAIICDLIRCMNPGPYDHERECYICGLPKSVCERINHVNR